MTRPPLGQGRGTAGEVSFLLGSFLRRITASNIDTSQTNPIDKNPPLFASVYARLVERFHEHFHVGRDQLNP